MNQKQKDARKTPEGKAKEALASRKSYWRKKFWKSPGGSEAEALAADRCRAMGLPEFGG